MFSKRKVRNIVHELYSDKDMSPTTEWDEFGEREIGYYPKLTSTEIYEAYLDKHPSEVEDAPEYWGDSLMKYIEIYLDSEEHEGIWQDAVRDHQIRKEP